MHPLGGAGNRKPGAQQVEKLALGFAEVCHTEPQSYLFYPYPSSPPGP